MKNAKQFRSWLKKRPRHIRELARKFPPGRYRIRKGAPYAISCEGTEVTLASYKEDGVSLGVIVHPKNLLPPAIEHIKMLNFNYKNPPETGLDSAQMCSVEGKWMELLESHVG